MAKYQRIVTTKAGLELLESVTLGGTIQFTSLKTGTGTYDGTEDLAAMTSIKSVRQTFGIGSVTKETSDILVRTILCNNDVTVGYAITELGLYTKNPTTGAEVLFAITVAASGCEDYMPVYAEEPTSIVVDFVIGITDAEKVTFAVAPMKDTYVQLTTFNEFVAKTNDEIALERARIDTFTSLPDGATQNDAALADICVGFNGTTYASPGIAVRTQFANVNNEVTGVKSDLSEVIQPSNTQVNSSNYSDIGFTDANAMLEQRTFHISNNITKDMVKNLPSYGADAIFTVTRYSSNTNSGMVQFYFSVKDACYRIITGTQTNPTFEKWESMRSTVSSLFAVGKQSDVEVTIDETNHTLSISGNNYIWGASTFIKANTLTVNSVSLEHTLSFGYPFVVYIRDNELRKDNFTSYRPINTDIIVAYLYLNPNGKIIDNVWTLGIDKEKETEEPTVIVKSPTNERTCAIFQKVVCCGDSYTSGHIQTDMGTSYNAEKFAWPAFMEKLTGNTYVNCGNSGATVIGWQTSGRGLLKAQSVGKAQAYLIGLGINDATKTELGTSADIGTDAQTYYGGLSAIIRELNVISPNAHIFVQTMPRTAEKYTKVNVAMREVVSAYANTYNVHLLDLENYIDLYNDSSLTGDLINGHFTAIGYQQCAEILCKVWSDYINNNIAKFQNVHLIEYDE